ncbi:hypothetical protein L1987_21427 [Smallanthus sonchifolius]|uniref:Uncharacterized protein n=1 Tax=Smallanthus sonchifolius TaxID=185202 RepID=A0ACB9IW07_9ASTR|nr:hypothetical protein L1987_21427 [Smallanthus sonchifolius]
MHLLKTHQGGLLVRPHNMDTRFLIPKQGIVSRTKWSLVPGSWMQGCTSACLVIGLLVCNSSSEPVLAEAKVNKQDNPSSSTTNFSHGKQVYIDYSVTEIPGDGRCLFRAIAHGACVRSGKSVPNESLQKELADELHARAIESPPPPLSILVITYSYNGKCAM